jgi:hypothetical protein
MFAFENNVTSKYINALLLLSIQMSAFYTETTLQPEIGSVS